MTQYRVPKKTSKYYVPEEVYKTTVHYCRQYPLWKQELEADPDASKAIDYSTDRVQTSSQPDPTSDIAMRRATIRKKKETVEHVAHTVAGTMHTWLILGACHGLTYYQLRDRGIPCGKNMYSALRQRFYYEMSKLI